MLLFACARPNEVGVSPLLRPSGSTDRRVARFASLQEAKGRALRHLAARQARAARALPAVRPPASPDTFGEGLTGQAVLRGSTGRTDTWLGVSPDAPSPTRSTDPFLFRQVPQHIRRGPQIRFCSTRSSGATQPRHKTGRRGRTEARERGPL